jgi:transposase
MAGYVWMDGWMYGLMVLLQKHLLEEKTQDQIPHTDRSKSGTKRSIFVDGKGVPIGVSVDGANRHDMKMSKATLQSIVIYRPKPTMRSKQHICLDKGYDFPEVYELLEEYGYTTHIPLRGERRSRSSEVIPGYRDRHWVVERTHSWMNRFISKTESWGVEPITDISSFPFVI